MATNFSYLKGTRLAELQQTAELAEKNIYLNPEYAAISCRKALEHCLSKMFRWDYELRVPEDKNLNSYLASPELEKILGENNIESLHFIRLLGNKAAHKSRAQIQPEEALQGVRILFRFIGFVIKSYNHSDIEVPSFNKELIPTGKEQHASAKEVEQLEKKLAKLQQQLEEKEKELAKTNEQYKVRKVHTQQAVPDLSEQETRALYINLMLQEAGWDTTDPKTQEMPVTQMADKEGTYTATGFADYVFYGKDGKPVMVVEAKRTSVDADAGRQQARLYAGALEKKYGQRPVIFYSNGFETYIWDDAFYPPRRVHGFYTPGELDLLIARRDSKADLHTMEINKAIAGRPYQEMAIRSICEAIQDNHERKMLLVMATGTGKTRTAAALVDLLSRARWVKNVLFLADRNPLVTQAKNSFKDQLPRMPAVNLVTDKEIGGSRIVFSTYQTLINQIDRVEKGKRIFGPGFFVLIIFDEIHRSVYNKYKHIFNYFDGFKLGLTATPALQTDRDTYQLFDRKQGDPNYAYELDTAITEKYLVPYVPVNIGTRFQSTGIRYCDLSPEEQEEYREQLADPETGAYPEEVDAAAINQWLFNKDTVDKILAILMDSGLKVENGDKLGKTIIFARNHKHAKFIEERFNFNYPSLKGEFICVIDNQEKRSEELLARFKEASSYPQIAVSVDMLDTGVDVPEILNLVFFKPVRSPIKFWQMVGRGTRPCRFIFGKGEEEDTSFDKKEFFIFDIFRNFENFGETPVFKEVTAPKSMSRQLFELRLRLSCLLQEQAEPALAAYGEQLRQELQAQVNALPEESFIVRQHARSVTHFRKEESWQVLSTQDKKTLIHEIAPLIQDPLQEHELIRRFDLLSFAAQEALLADNKPQLVAYKNQVHAAARTLSKKVTIDKVKEKLPLLRSLQEEETWQELSVAGLEQIRQELRDLFVYLGGQSKEVFYTNFEDEILYAGPAEGKPVYRHINELEAYRERMEAYIREHRNYVVIHHLRHNIPITPEQLKQLEEMLHEQGFDNTDINETLTEGKSLGEFIRSITGLDREAVNEAFAAFLDKSAYNCAQLNFIETIIGYLCKNGSIRKGVLIDKPPFTQLHSQGLLGVFSPEEGKKIFSIIDQINRNGHIA